MSHSILPSWPSSRVKTPSKLHISFLPNSSSNSQTTSDHTSSFDHNIQPDHLIQKYNSSNLLPSKTQQTSSIQRDPSIFHQSLQTNSILNPLSYTSRLQDQTFPLITSNQSFTLEFSSPASIKDWSIHHSPFPENKQLAQESTSHLLQLSTKPNPTDQTNHPQHTQPSTHFTTNNPSTEYKKNSSLFDTHPSQIDPLPYFSPIKLPGLDQIHSQPNMQSALTYQQSPLSLRAKRLNPEVGKGNILTQSIVRPRSPLLSATTTLETKNQKKNLSGFSHSQLPDWLIGANISANNSPSKLSSTSIADVSVYLTPDASLIDDQNQILRAISEDHDKHVGLNPDDSTSSPCEIDINARYQVLTLLAENLMKDLSIKTQVIQVLQTDRDQAQKDREEIEQKMVEMTGKLQHAVMEQKTIRDQQVHKIAAIVQNLTCEVEAVMSKCELDRSEDISQLSSQKIHWFQTHLKSSKLAMEDFQQLLDELQNSNHNLDGFDPQQAKKIDACMKELDMLHHPLSQHLASDKNYLQDDSSPQEAVSEQDHQQSDAPLIKIKTEHEREVSRLKVEIDSLSNKLSVTSLHNQDLESLKQNVRMLEEEAKIRMEAFSGLRSQSLGLKHELESTKRALQLTEHGRSEALEELEKTRQALQSTQKTHFSEIQVHLERLSATRDQFNVDQTELMLKLKASNQQVEELRVQLERSKSINCKHCESKQVHSNMLEAERDGLRKKLSEIQTQSADKEVQITRLLKICSRLEHDKEGLNIALEAKQHENAYLKRDKAVREADCTCPSLGTSAKTSSTCTTIRGTSGSMADRTIQKRNRNLESTSENRDILSSITNVSKMKSLSKGSETISINPYQQNLPASLIEKKNHSFRSDSSKSKFFK